MSEEILKQLLEIRAELLGFIYTVVRDPHAAEDVFQDISIVVMRKAQAGDPILDFRAWVKEIARREVLHFLRRGAGRRPLTMPTAAMIELASEAYLAEDREPADFVDEFAALKNCLEKLPPRLSRLIRSRFVESRPYKELAETVGQSELAVRQAVSRARRALAECLQGALGWTV